MKSRFFYLGILIAGLILAGSFTNSVYGQNQQNTSVKKQTVLYTCTMHPEIVKNKPGKCPKCGMTLVVKKDKQQYAKKYTCPKDTDVVRDKPGKCPKCGMALVEKRSTKHRGMHEMHDTTKMKQHHMMKDTTKMKQHHMMKDTTGMKHHHMMKDSLKNKKEMMQDTSKVKMHHK
jgi:predicted RNA-binding Zn-ribbon protein involved in translation (DUF1610 family)